MVNNIYSKYQVLHVLCLLSSLLDCTTAQVNIDLHLGPVQVTGDDVRHQAAPQT